VSSRELDDWYYVLDDGGTPKPASMHEWVRWMTANPDGRRVALTDLDGGVTVSTVFLALNHSFRGGPPVLYETMVFRDDEGRDCWRWHTREQAVAGHDQVVAALRDGRDPACVA
jgi:hypothetical protein